MLAAQKAGHGGCTRIGSSFEGRSGDFGFVPKSVVQNLSSTGRLAHSAILPGVGDFGKNESSTQIASGLIGAASSPVGLGMCLQIL